MTNPTHLVYEHHELTLDSMDSTSNSFHYRNAHCERCGRNFRTLMEDNAPSPWIMGGGPCTVPITTLHVQALGIADLIMKAGLCATPRE